MRDYLLLCRSLRYLNREYCSDSDHSVASSMRSLSLKSSKTSTLPSSSGSRAISTMPRVKQSLDSYSWSRESTSIEEKTPSPRIRHENGKLVYRPNGVVVKNIAFRARGLGSIPGWSNRTQCRQRLATAAMLLRSYVAPSLSHGDVLHHSLHALA